jgi:ADP-ribose pyrophosphatase YjhB (NUDIX family)
MNPPIIKIAALCIRDRKLLLVRSRNYQAFFTLGGKLESGETDEQCLIREVQEEVSCEIVSTKYFQTFEGLAHDKTRNVRLICYFVELKNDPTPSSEIAEIHWWDSQSQIILSDMLTLHLLPALQELLD